MTLQTVTGKDRCDVFRIGNLARRLDLLHAANETTDRFGLLHADFFSRQHFLDSHLQIMSIRLLSNEPDTVLIIDAASIAHLAIGVEQKDFRRPLGVEPISDGIADVS